MFFRSSRHVGDDASRAISGPEEAVSRLIAGSILEARAGRTGQPARPIRVYSNGGCSGVIRWLQCRPTGWRRVEGGRRGPYWNHAAITLPLIKRLIMQRMTRS